MGSAPTPGLLGVAAAVLLAGGLLGCGSSASRSRPPRPSTTRTSRVPSPHVASSYTIFSPGPSQEAPRPAPTQPLTSAAAPGSPDRLLQALRRGQARRRQAGCRRPDRRAPGRLEGARGAALAGDLSDYLELGAVYLTGALADLNQRIDGTAGGVPGRGLPHFEGLHRIEYGLWTGADPRSLAPVGTRLQSALAEMAAKLPHAQITPLEYTLRAHEILEDAQRDQLSGTDVAWSGEGVLGTEAGLTATEHVLASMHVLLHPGTDAEEIPIGPRIETELATLRSVFQASIERAHGGHLPPNNGLPRDEAEALQGALGGSLEALAQVPPTLEQNRPRSRSRSPRRTRGSTGERRADRSRGARERV